MLPFIAGAVIGAGAVVAYNKSDKIKNSIDSGAKKVKKVATEGFEITKEKAKDIKASVNDKVESIKSKDKKIASEAKAE
ncbi:MAG: YtxH domain-containing protein [Sphaerochaetaceae bacterium]|nr:YtxH domain-containing protein [Sphaerochaetaceae bacterium]